MRWADMDMLGHVNNVTYVDYLQEARIDMFAEHAPFRGGEELAEGVVVVRHEVEFVAPLVFHRHPVSVESWVTQVRAGSFSVAYEVFDEADREHERQVYLRATTVLAPYVFATESPRRISGPEREVLERFLEPAPPRERVHGSGPEHIAGGHDYALKVRWSDVDAYRHVNNVQYFEFFQEARIQYMMSMHRKQDGAWSEHVVARTDVTYRRPILFRREPYTVHSWISRVGTRSFTISAEIRDGGEVLASSDVVMVTFDSRAQRAAPMPEAQRTRLLAELGV
jgi:acyl-CoA thioester hydrolase